MAASGGKFRASGSAGGGFDIATGGAYAIGGTELLTATSLAATVLVDGDSLRINNCNNTLASFADADLMLVDDNAAGDPKKATLGNLKTFFQTGVSATSTNGFAFNTYSSSSSTNLNGASGFWGTDASDGTVATALNLDLSGSWTNGNVVIIKAANNAATNNITVRANVGGGQTIDGENSILLESNNAAVTLVYGNDNWNIV